MNLKKLFLILFAALMLSVIILLLLEFSDLGGRGFGSGGMGDNASRSYWLILIGALAVAFLIVLVYLMVFPDLSARKPEAEAELHASVKKEEPALDAVVRVLKEDEKKVLEVLIAEGGTMLQKDIRWKTKFSRVKTHRILMRLIERGVVTAEKHYNTNKITLADWLKNRKNITDNTDTQK